MKTSLALALLPVTALACACIVQNASAATEERLIYLNCTSEFGGRPQVFINRTTQKIGLLNVTELPLIETDTEFRGEVKTPLPNGIARVAIIVNRFTLDTTFVTEPPWPGMAPVTTNKCTLEQRKL